VVNEVGCPAFVPLIEAGDLSHPDLRAAAQSYLEPLLQSHVEAIVLGCTHYPLLTPLLQELLPDGVQLIDPALAAVARLGPLLANLGDLPEGERQHEQTPPPGSLRRICVTGCALTFAEAATRWLGEEPRVEQVDLSEKVDLTRQSACGF
jgi:glutamate racemase